MNNDNFNGVELRPGTNVIEIDMNELAVRIMEAMIGFKRPEPDAAACLDMVSDDTFRSAKNADEAAADFIMGTIASATRAN